MLTETERRVRDTSWRWIRGETDDGLAGDQIIDPFDGVVNVVRGGTLTSTGRAYGRLEALEPLLKNRLDTVIGGLVNNGQILTGDPYDADDDLFQMHADHKAVMAPRGHYAVPVALLGPDAQAGTDAVATCVAVLGRVRLGNEWLVGCTHLAASDMSPFDRAYASVGNLLTEMQAAAARKSKQVTSFPVQLYAVGGREDETGTYREFSRIIGAIQQHVQDRAPGWLELAGAVLPANQLRHGLAVHISSRGVIYTSDESSDDDQGSDEQDSGSDDGGSDDGGSGDG
jgi:hypothetical protein